MVKKSFTSSSKSKIDPISVNYTIENPIAEKNTSKKPNQIAMDNIILSEINNKCLRNFDTLEEAQESANNLGNIKINPNNAAGNFLLQEYECIKRILVIDLLRN